MDKTTFSSLMEKVRKLHQEFEGKCVSCLTDYPCKEMSELEGEQE